MIWELNLRYPEARIGGRSGIYPDSVGSSGLRALQFLRASSKRLFMGVMFWCSSKPISPLQCTLTKNAPVSPLESTLTKLLDLKSPGITLLQKIGGWGVGPSCQQLAATNAHCQVSWARFPGCAAEHSYPQGVTMRPSNSSGGREFDSPTQRD